ncbi:MAG: Gfo/Idh/MocA family oxidoreductase [Chloroflexi bacterium]|nr:Gfo/Idh/MocA family oxidoreductase [Chloroflexota bacterium]
MIGVAVVGCGYWGPLHIRGFSASSRSRVVYAVDASPARLAHIRQTYPAVGATQDFDTALSADVQAVVIATPAGTHFELARRALCAGKHVLVEKPLTTEVATARELVGLAQSRGLVLMVGHTFMYHATVRELQRLIRAGDLGDIYYVNSTRVNLGLHRKDVDVLWDLGAHDVSILRFLLAADPAVSSAYGAGFHDPDVAEVAYVELRYPGNVLANIHVSWLDPVKIRRLTVVGSRRMAVWDDVEPVEKLRIHDKGMKERPYYDDFGQWQVAYRDGDVHVPVIPWVEPLRAEAEHFLDCIETGASPLTDGADGLAVVETLTACSAKLRLRGTASTW